MSKNTISGKTVLIAGGAKNLGGLIARDLSKNGAKGIGIHYHSAASADDAQTTAETVRANGAQAVVLSGDLTSAAAMTRLFDEAEAALGKIDIAINTTGMVLKKPIVDVNEEEYDSMFAINTKAAFFFLKEAGARVNDQGKILTLVTSLLGAYTPFYATYAGAKAAVEHFTRAASKEFGSRGVSVNAAGPGPMDTPFFYGQETQEAVDYHKTAAALSPFSNTGLTDIEDIVPLIRFLVSEGWWITGQTILSNGGYTTK